LTARSTIQVDRCRKLVRVRSPMRQCIVEVKTFPGTLDSLEPVRECVAAAAHAAGLDRGSTYRLCLAVDEIATNVVLHGYEESGLTGDIVIEVAREPDKLIIRLVDHGRPYSPDLIATPDLQGDLLDRQEGGLGVFLAKDGVDQFDYATTDRGNIHRFVMQLHSNDSKET
jgi:serine/threonine-protein kinase RsbW